MIDDDTMAKLAPRDRGIWRALNMHRREDPRRWRQLVDAIEDAEERAAADGYLRVIVARMRASKAANRDNPRP